MRRYDEVNSEKSPVAGIVMLYEYKNGAFGSDGNSKLTGTHWIRFHFT